MIKYEIEGGNLPVVICYPHAGQTLCTERGAMSWMSPNMQMETRVGGLRKAMGRLLSGDSVFLNEFSVQGESGVIAFASSFPGSIIPFELQNESIIVQKTAFLAMEKGLDLSMYFQKRLGKGLFGGEGFILQRISGTGTAFLEIDGYCKEYTLSAGQSIIVGTGHLAAMSESCTMNIQAVSGAKNIFFGGEGLFHTVISGPGKVWLQSMPIANMVEAMTPYLPHQSSGEGISIKLGDN